MARAWINANRFVGISLVSVLAAAGCYYDNFEKVDEIDDGTGGTSSASGGLGAAPGSGGAMSSSGGNPGEVEDALAVTDEYYIRQGDDLLRELLTNDGGRGLEVTGSDPSDPNRPSSLDPANFSVSDAGVLNFTPHADFWGTFRATYDIIDENDETSTGEIIIHVLPEAISLATIEAGWGGIVIDGDTGDELGFSLDGLGDFNGDGRSDLAIGAPGANSDKGRVAVIFGGEDLADLDLSGTNDNVQFYVGDAGTAALDRAGQSVSKAGNLNGDLFQDLIVGAGDLGQDGRAYVIYGLGNPAGADKAFTDTPTAVQGFTLSGSAGNRTGRFVSGGADINGDGSDDVVVFNQDNSGTFHAVFGTTSGVLAGDLQFNSELINAPRMALLGDLYGLDERAEVILPAFAGGANGHIALLRGKTGADAMNLWPADGSFTEDTEDGFLSSTFSAPGELEEPSMTSAGEFDGDAGEDLAYCTNAGTCLIAPYLGLTSSDDHLDEGRVINGFTANPPRVNGGGNLNNDNFDDLIFAEGTSAYVLWGTETPPTAALDIAADIDEEGFSIDPEGETIGEVAIVGDVNDDGIDDFAVAIPSYEGNNGRVYIIFGTVGSLADLND